MSFIFSLSLETVADLDSAKAAVCEPRASRSHDKEERHRQDKDKNHLQGLEQSQDCDEGRNQDHDCTRWPDSPGAQKEQEKQRTS